MRTEVVMELLTHFMQHDIVIYAYDEMLGEQYQVLFLRGWVHQIVDDCIVIVSINGTEHKYEFGEIVRVAIYISQEERINMIEQATTLQEAYNYAKDDNMTPTIEEALDRAKERLKPTPERAEQRILGIIESRISFKGTTLRATSVLEYLCLNILGKEKIDYTATQEQLYAIAQGIEDAIKKLGEMPF